MITRILKLKKAWIVFLIAFIASFIMAGSAKAEEDPAKKYNVTFPVVELGGCSNISECRIFCEDPVNRDSCISYAKKKGFYKEPEVAGSKKNELVAAAKKELGCDSESSCRSLCSDQANFDKCDAFAKKRGLNGGHIEDPANRKILEKAKEILGCNSPDSCSSFCSKEENKQKCSEFAKETGLRGGEQRVGPGGCTSEETCKAFCSDPQNFSVCKGFMSSSGGNFSGPGGCNSEESCRAYCRGHEDECRSLGGGGKVQPPGYNPQEMCLKTPNCKWEENTCQCGFYGGQTEERNRTEEYARFCRENPEKCRSGQGFNQEGNKMSRENQEAACKFGGGICDWSSGVCNCRGYRSGNDSTSNQSPRPYATSYSGSDVPSTTTGGTMDPVTGCRNAGGSWNGSYCQMPTPSTSNTTQNTAPSGMSRDSQEAGCRSCGGTCSWNGDFCNCQCSSSGSSGDSSPAPAQTSASQPVQQEQAPQPVATTAPAVQGITAVRNILERILDFFR